MGLGEMGLGEMGQNLIFSLSPEATEGWHNAGVKCICRVHETVYQSQIKTIHKKHQLVVKGSLLLLGLVTFSIFIGAFILFSL